MVCYLLQTLLTGADPCETWKLNLFKRAPTLQHSIIFIRAPGRSEPHDTDVHPPFIKESNIQ